MQKIVDNGAIVLTADNGMMLTDGNCYGTTVRLGKEADEMVWYEITAEEAEKWMNEEIADDEATKADYQVALREMGVKI